MYMSAIVHVSIVHHGYITVHLQLTEDSRREVSRSPSPPRRRTKSPRSIAVCVPSPHASNGHTLRVLTTLQNEGRGVHVHNTLPPSEVVTNASPAGGASPGESKARQRLRLLRELRRMQATLRCEGPCGDC